ncbi:DMT family transporter [Xanthobacter sediminis]
MLERRDRRLREAAIAPPAERPGRSWVKGVLFKLVSAFMFMVMSALIREVGTRVPTGEVVFARSFFALVPLVAWLWWRGNMLAALRTGRPFGHLLRGAIGVCSMFCNFVAVARLPLPDATALSYAAPLVTTLFAALVLSESVGPHRWAAACVGLGGVIVILWPQLASGALAAVLTSGGDASETAIGAAFAVVGATTSGVAMIQLRRLTQTEGSGAIVFYFSVWSAIMGLASSLILGWVWPDPYVATLLVGTGLAGGIGQILLTESYRNADASLIAPFEYTTILWALAIGFFAFGELPSVWTVAGGTIVIGSSAAVLLRERSRGALRTRI